MDAEGVRTLAICGMLVLAGSGVAGVVYLVAIRPANQFTEIRREFERRHREEFMNKMRGISKEQV